MNMKVVAPPTDVVKAFTHHAASLLKRVAANRVEGDTLAAIRDALLPKLLSGEIRVPEAQEIAEAAESDPEEAAEAVKAKVE